ncbi:MAG: hypothetical protein ACI4IK_08375 [Eubacterium sp.]
MKKHKKLLCAAIALIMVFSVAFSVLFIAKEANHSCVARDCQICQQISACFNLLNNMSPDISSASALTAVSFAVLMIIGSVINTAVSNTLINQKVKLSN